METGASLVFDLQRKKPYCNKTKIYCDMDGVLCDFDLSYLEYKERAKKEGVLLPREISRIDEIREVIDYSFWIEMPWALFGKELWDSIKMYNPTLLTAPPKPYKDIATIGKKGWAGIHLGENIPVIVEIEKEMYAEHGAVLIDDRAENIRLWEEKGGIGILHTLDHPERTLNILSFYGL